MELNINKCSVLSITLKRNYIFHDNDILGATLKRVTNHDYLGVTISSDLNWLRHSKKIIIRQAESLVYLEEPYPPAHKMLNLLPTKCLFGPNLNMLVKSGARIQRNVLRKLNKFKETHADSSFMNTVETLTPLFSLTG